MALSLFGVTVVDTHANESTPGVELVALRDLVAICGERPYRAVEPDDATVKAHSDVVLRFSARGPVLPSPIGVVFRSPDSVQRWLELHYGALSDALAYVENRVAARVHARSAPLKEGEEKSADLVLVAGEGLRALRRAAVASLPLRADRTTGVLSSAAFLIEEINWKEFAAEVDAQTKLTPEVQFELTGPWGAYDFVQMQLGA